MNEKNYHYSISYRFIYWAFSTIGRLKSFQTTPFITTQPSLLWKFDK